MVDHFTRLVELEAIPDARAETVADALVSKIILHHVCSVLLLSDRGSQFTSRLFIRMSRRLGVKNVYSTAYHPQTNGQVERMNRYVATAMSANVEEDQLNWDDHLEEIPFAHRTSIVDAINDTPFHSVHGRDARLPKNVFEGDTSEKRGEESYGDGLIRHLREAMDRARDSQSRADER